MEKNSADKELDVIRGYFYGDESVNDAVKALEAAYQLGCDEISNAVPARMLNEDQIEDILDRVRVELKRLSFPEGKRSASVPVIKNFNENINRKISIVLGGFKDESKVHNELQKLFLHFGMEYGTTEDELLFLRIEQFVLMLTVQNWDAMEMAIVAMLKNRKLMEKIRQRKHLAQRHDVVIKEKNSMKQMREGTV